MNSRPNLRVRISADLADIRQGLGLLRGELASVRKQAAAAMPNLGSNAAVAGVRRLRQELTGLVGAYLSLRGVGLLSGIADEASLIRGRIKAAKGDYEALLQLAQETRSGFAGTVDLYARMERSTRNQQISQDRLLKVTRAVNQAIKLSYADQSAGDAAVMQLGQGLASGTLRGEELNSVMEQTPRLAEAIANGMGKPLGALRALAKEGKVTSEAVIKALEDQAETLEREYAAVPVTIKDALTQIRNSFVDYIGDQDAATGASRRFAETLQEIARDLPKYLDPLLQVLTLILRNLDVLAVFLVARFAGAAIPAVIVAVTRLVAILRAASTAAVTLRSVLMLLGGPVGIVLAALSAAIYLVWKRTNDAKVAADEHRTAMEANKNMAYQSAQAALADAKAKRQQAFDTLKAARAALEEARVRQETERARMGRASGPNTSDLASVRTWGAQVGTQNAQRVVDQAERAYFDWGKRLVELSLQISDEVLAPAAELPATVTDTSGDGKKAVKGVADAAELAADAIKRQQAALELMLEDGKISLQAFYAEKERLELASIDASIAQAREEARVAKTSDQQSKALTEIIKLQRDRAEVGPRVAREQADAERELNGELDKLRARLLEAQGNTFGARQIELRQEFDELLRRLPEGARQTGQAIVDQLFPIETARAQLSAFEQVQSEAMARLQAREQSLSAQQQAGLLGVLQSEEQIKGSREQALQQLLDLREKAIDFLSTLSADSPEAARVLEFLQRLDGDIAGVSSSMQRFRQQVADNAIDSVTNLFMDLVEGSKTAGEALRDFVRSFVLGMAQIAARAMATFLVLKLLDAVYPGLGKATAAMMNVGQSHGGGKAGRPGAVRRPIPAALVGSAPRHHGGGVAGMEPGTLKHNEVVEVLERGETIRTQEQEAALERQLGAGGGAGSRVTTPVVVIGDQAVANALAGHAGEDIVMTHVRNNWDALVNGAG